MEAATPPPPPPPADQGPSMASSIERKLSPGVVLLIAILAMVFFIIGLLNLLVQNLLRLRRARRRRRQVGDAVASPTAFQGQLGELFHLHDAGVDQASIDALPVFPYHAVAASGHGNGGKGPFDCAVCLCEFAGDDKLRLLPTCGHAFHVPCIDAWLLSHSTCPLCRGSILAAFADADADECSPPSSPSALLALRSESIREMVAAGGGGGDPADRDEEEAPPKDAEEIVEVKLGKLRCVDGNAASARNLDAGNGSRGSLGQRRCLSMGSYEYVMDEHAALRVAVKAPKTRAASSALRRRHALSECDFGGSNSKKGAWETAVTEAAAAGRCGSGGSAASLKRDSFSTSKIWMVPAASRREEGGRRAAEPAGVRRAASFRWPAMSAGGKKQHRGGGGEASWDVEAAAGGGRRDDGAPAPAEERLSLARAAMIWVAGGRQGSHS